MPIVAEIETRKIANLQSAAILGGSELISLARELSPPTERPPAPMAMTPTAMEGLSEITRTMAYAKGSILFHQGERPAGVFVLKRGAIKLSMSSSKGRAVILRIVKAGEILALSAILAHEPCFATAETLEDSEVAYTDGEQFVDFLRHHPEAALSVASQACANYKNACRQISLLGLCWSARERLAQFLLNWAPVKPLRNSSEVWLGLTHEEIAQLAGTTRETVTRTLTDFRKKGWASLTSSKLELKDRAALEKLVA